MQRLNEKVELLFGTNCCLTFLLFHPEFRELQKKSEFERAEWIRKQGNCRYFSVTQSQTLTSQVCFCNYFNAVHRASFC